MRHTMLALAVPAVIGLAACGGSDDSTTLEATEVGTEAAEVATDGATDPGDALDDGASEDTTGAGAAGGDPAARPDPGTCVTLPEAPDGLYTVADAGTVELTFDGETLVLGDSVAADGWEVEETEEERDEVEVEFRRDGEELDFEAEIEDGVLQVQVCADDD